MVLGNTQIICFFLHILGMWGIGTHFYNKQAINIDELKKQLTLLNSPKTLRQTLPEISSLNDHGLTLEYLKKAYPDVEDFM